MKKLSTVIILLCVFLLMVPQNKDIQAKSGQVTQQEIADKIIRFHVIANSDSTKDQQLKLKVRDEILKYIAPILKNSKSLDESRKLIRENDEKMKNIAAKVIKENGYSYKVNSTFGQTNFPVKEYGNIVLPEGTYEAYRIVIGSGQGKNWWCVMFPPLCFVDITKGEVAYDETKQEMKTVLNDNEFNYIDKSQQEEISEDENSKIQIRFKIVDVINEIFNSKSNQ